MKFVVHVIAVVLVSWLLQYFMPWWVMAVGAFALGLAFRQNGYASFMAGFIGVGLLWFAVAAFTDLTAGSVLSSRIVGILPIGSTAVLIGITALIGALVGGLASMSGGLITQPKKSKY